MKRLLCLLMALVICIPICSMSFSVRGADVGDVNEDGKIDTQDALLILKFVSDVQLPTSSQKAAADYNGDGALTTDDVYDILLTLISPDSDEGYIRTLMQSGFPRSYAESLLALHKKYPEWEFKPFITGLKWADAVKGEHTPHNKQLIENSVEPIWMCQCSSCKGVIQESNRWVSASQEAVEYYLDPRNFLDEKSIFQFETTTYDASHTIESVEAILKSTWMHNSKITYLNPFGTKKTYVLDGKEITYAQAIMKAAKDKGMSAYYLASKIVQEVGSSSASNAGGSCGNKAPYNGIYNYYNIGAYTGAVDGLKWANGYMKTKAATKMYKEAKTSSTVVKSLGKDVELYYIQKVDDFYRASATVEGTKYTGYIPVSNVSLTTSYGRPWTSPYKSIYYGAEYIYNGYSQYQFTGYLQKFNVNADSGKLYNHEYMANIRAAASEAKKTYNAYESNGVLKTKKTFSIPVFTGMPGADLTNNDLFLETSPVLKSSSQTTESIVLDWSKVRGATGYQVYKYNSSSEKFEKLTNVTGLTYEDKTLTPAKTAIYKVRAYKKHSDGTYSYSAYSNKFYGAAKPTKPGTLSQVSVSESAVKLKWSSVTCTGYQLYRATGTTYTKIATITDNTYTDTAVTSGKTYKYKVRAYKKADSMTSYSYFSPVLTVSAKKSETSTKATSGVVKVETNLNVRASASTQAEVIVKVPNGQSVDIVAEEGEWYKVNFVYEGTDYTGYVHSEYIVLDTEVTEPEVTEPDVKDVCPYTEPTTTVSDGSSGDGVKWVQWYLWKLDYLGESDIDGAFGPTTLAAVKAFQTDLSLDVDGRVGPATRTALKNSYN